MSILLPLVQFFHVEDLSREVVVSSVINTLSENINFIIDILPILTKGTIIVRGEVYSIQHYVIKFVRDLQQVSDVLRILEVVVSSVINTLSENIKLVRKISQALCPPFKSSTLFPKQSKK
jgi:predicted nucleic-acid-binding protein